MVGVLSPGILQVYTIDPNPYGAGDSSLFAFSGDVTKEPVREIHWPIGTTIPEHSALSASQTFSLRIYHFNDIHGHLTHIRPGGEEPILARLASEFRAARNTCQHDKDAATLVLAAGDDCTGSIFDEMMAAGGTQFLHPGYHIYSKLGLDAAALGNHDLDRGLPYLTKAIRKDARFPVLSANLVGCGDLSDVCCPAVILVVKGIRVGLIGLVTRAETRLHPAQCQIVDPIKTAINLLPAIRPYCDVLIVLSHLGYCLKDSSIPMADAGDVELAHSLPTGLVDLIIGGHSHNELNKDGLSLKNVINHIPILQAGARGEYLGRVDITVKRDCTTVNGAQLIPVQSLPVDQDFEEREIRPLLHQAKKLLARSLGMVEANPELGSETVMGDFARAELALSNFVTDALMVQLARSGLETDLVMIDSSAFQCGLPVGEALTYQDWFAVMPYTDTVRLFSLTPQQLKALLKDNVLRIDRPGEIHIERGFLQFSHQLRYQVSLGENRKSAVPKNITLDSFSLNAYPKDSLTIATTSFTRQRSKNWENTLEPQLLDQLVDLNNYHHTETEIFLRQEMVSYIHAHGGVSSAGGAKRDGRLMIFKPVDENNRKSDEFNIN